MASFSKLCVMSALVLMVSSGPSIVACQAMPGELIRADARERQTLQTQISVVDEMLRVAQHQAPSSENKIKIRSMKQQLASLRQRLKEMSLASVIHRPDSSQNVISRSHVVLL